MKMALLFRNVQIPGLAKRRSERKRGSWENQRGEGEATVCNKNKVAVQLHFNCNYPKACSGTGHNINIVTREKHKTVDKIITSWKPHCNQFQYTRPKFLALNLSLGLYRTSPFICFCWHHLTAKTNGHVYSKFALKECVREKEIK